MTTALTLQLKSVLGSERQQLARFLRLLADVDRSRTYAEEGYPNLYDYSMQSLGLSDGETANRIRVCRVGQRFPEVFAMIEAGKVSLTAVRQLAPWVDHEDFLTTLSQAAGKTTREVEKLAATLAVSVAKVATKRAADGAPNADVPLGFVETAAAGAEAPKATPGTRERIRFVTPERAHVSLTADQAFTQKVERAQALRRAKGKDASLEAVLSAALDAYLEAHDPAVVMKRRRDRAATRQAKAKATEVTKATRPTRRIPAQVAASVWHRDEGQCTFTTRDGHRCPARVGLEIDHGALPFGLGGSSSNPEELSLLCRAHNRLMAERVYGKDKIAAFAGP